MSVSKALLLGTVFAVWVLPGAVFAQSSRPSLPGFSYSVDDFFSDPEEEEEEASSSSPLTPAYSGATGIPGGSIPGQPGSPGAFTLDDIKEETRRQAFDAALEGIMPLRPEEIRTLLERYDRTQESASDPPVADHRPLHGIVRRVVCIQ